MTESSLEPPTDPDVLRQAVETFRVYSGVVLLSLARHGQDLRHRIIRNFIARGMSCTQSIFSVWRAGSEQDAWILDRTLVHRLLHLHYLAESDGFSDFEQYSFLSMYEARHKLLSDPDMNAKVPLSLRELQRADRPKYDAISAKSARWRRPKAADVAKSMNLGFLYRFGYDYASTHVHPMAADGEGDYTALISAPHAVTVPDATVMRNSILVQSMVVQEAFNVSQMRWRAIAYDFLDQIRVFLGTGDPQCHMTFGKISKVWPELQLCEPVTSSEGA